MGIQLNPLVRLRRDRGRILIYRVDPVLRLVDKHGFIPPLSAILLSLFDGTRGSHEVLTDFSYLLGDGEPAAGPDTVVLSKGERAAAEGGGSPGRYLAGLPEEELRGRVASFATTILSSVGRVFGADLLVPVNGSGPRLDMDPFDYVMDPKEVDISPRDGRLVAPLEINYVVTHTCPRRCLYCYAETYLAPRLDLLPLDRVEAVAREAGRLRVNAMYLSGGDPFARKEILEIVRLLVANRVPPFLSTKSHLKRRTCDRLRELGIEHMQVSLDAADEALADELTGSRGFYREILETLDNLQALGIRVRVKAVVTSRNLRAIPGLLEYLAGRGVRAIQLSGYGRSVYRHADTLFPGNDDLAWLADQTRAFATAHPEVALVLSNVQPRPPITPELKRRTWAGRSACSAGRTAMTVLPDGKVTICDQLPSEPTYYLGDLARQSILEVWNSERVQRFLLPSREELAGTACFSCPDFEDCHRLKSRCLRDVYNVFRDARNPDPACPRSGIDVRI